jgi:hypothetical protein
MLYTINSYHRLGDPDIVSQVSIDLQFLIQAGNARAQADEKMMSAGSPYDEHGLNQATARGAVLSFMFSQTRCCRPIPGGCTLQCAIGCW